MKLIFADEDCVFGLITGAFIIGFSGLYFNIEKIVAIKWIPILLFGIALFLTGLDIGYTIIHFFQWHPVVHFFGLLTNLVDIIIELGFFAYFLNWNIPFISNYFGFLENPTIILYLGVFVFASSAIWLMMYPFID